MNTPAKKIKSEAAARFRKEFRSFLNELHLLAIHSRNRNLIDPIYAMLRSFSTLGQMAMQHKLLMPKPIKEVEVFDFEEMMFVFLKQIEDLFNDNEYPRINTLSRNILLAFRNVAVARKRDELIESKRGEEHIFEEEASKISLAEICDILDTFAKNPLTYTTGMGGLLVTHETTPSDAGPPVALSNDMGPDQLATLLNRLKKEVITNHLPEDWKMKMGLTLRKLAGALPSKSQDLASKLDGLGVSMLPTGLAKHTQPKKPLMVPDRTVVVEETANSTKKIMETEDIEEAVVIDEDENEEAVDPPIIDDVTDSDETEEHTPQPDEGEKQVITDDLVGGKNVAATMAPVDSISGDLSSIPAKKHTTQGEGETAMSEDNIATSDGEGEGDQPVGELQGLEELTKQAEDQPGDEDLIKSDVTEEQPDETGDENLLDNSVLPDEIIVDETSDPEVAETVTEEPPPEGESEFAEDPEAETSEQQNDDEDLLDETVLEQVDLPEASAEEQPPEGEDETAEGSDEAAEEQPTEASESGNETAEEEETVTPPEGSNEAAEGQAEPSSSDEAAEGQPQSTETEEEPQPMSDTTQPPVQEGDVLDADGNPIGDGNNGTDQGDTKDVAKYDQKSGLAAAEKPKPTTYLGRAVYLSATLDCVTGDLSAPGPTAEDDVFDAVFAQENSIEMFGETMLIRCPGNVTLSLEWLLETTDVKKRRGIKGKRNPTAQVMLIAPLKIWGKKDQETPDWAEDKDTFDLEKFMDDHMVKDDSEEKTKQPGGHMKQLKIRIDMS